MARQITIDAPDPGRIAVVMMEGDTFAVVHIGIEYMNDPEAWEQAAKMLREQVEAGVRQIETWRPPND